MNDWTGRTAVITGAASGFGLEASRVAAARGMNVVMADVQQKALDTAAAEIRGLGAQVLAFRFDVAKGAEVETLAAATVQRFGVPHCLQQRRRRRRWPDLGAHGEGLGVGRRRQPDGRGARRARLHAADAGRGRGRPGL
jgi:NAD(P)-dependent dehydrogenase (short-subunit alcohol dehydrogenase family)